MILPLIVAAMGMFVFAVLFGINYRNIQALNNEFNLDRDAYLDKVKGSLDDWYQKNANMETQTSTVAYSSEQLFSMIGEQPRYGARLIMSQQLNDGTVHYHKIAIVLPGRPIGNLVGNEGYGSYSSTGVFVTTPGFVYKEYDGSQAQYADLHETTESMKKLATMLELRVSARMQIDPLHDNANNLFLPSDCANVKDNEFPCTNGWVAIRGYLENSRLLGEMSGIVTKDAWGNDIEFSNDLSNNQTDAPYTASLMTTTPWGDQLSVKAVQPIF